MTKIKSLFATYRLPILAGILFGTAYIPFPPITLWIAWFPLWTFARKEFSNKKIFIGGWITQALLALIGFHWIAHTAREFGQLPWPVAAAVLFLFMSFCHLQFPLSLLVANMIRKRWTSLDRRFDVFLFVGVFIVIDQFWPMIFRWNMGYPWLYANLPGAQVAEWVGFEGLHVLTLIISVFLYQAWISLREPTTITIEHRKNFRRSLQWSLGLFILVNLFGIFLNHKEELLEKTETANFLVIQGNIANLEKSEAEHGKQFLTEILNTFTGMTDKGLAEHPTTHYIVWPETAFPSYIDVPGFSLNQKLSNWRTSTEKEFLIGGYSQQTKPKHSNDPNGPTENWIYNALFYLKGNEPGFRARYQKTELLAYGEYFPLAEWFPALRELFPFISNFGRGEGPTVFKTDHHLIGPQICYEGLFPEFTAALKRKGAQVVLNVTNDSWFGYPFEPIQHLYMTAGRSVENRIPMVRSTNTGITAWVNRRGQVLQKGDFDKPWIGFYEVPVSNTPPTLFSYLAPFMKLILTLFAVLLIGGCYARSKKS